jgi:2-dehydro-3-deoxyglucarate aldolase
MNVFKQLLKAAGHHPPVGTWILSASPIVAEAVGHAGFDWGVIDMEHTPLDMMGVIHLLQAVAATKMVPVLRVPWHDAVEVRRALDAGAQTLMFPCIESATDAVRAVATMRYAPQGVRGLSGMSRATRFGTLPHYAKTAHQHMGVIVQLETPQAVEQLEAIAAVEGVDAIFLGPADLSASMGHAGEPMHPSVMELLGRAAQRCKALRKPVGTVGATPETVVQYRAAGFDFVAISSDLGLLMRGAQAAVHALRTQEVGAHVHTLAGGTRTDDASY